MPRFLILAGNRLAVAICALLALSAVVRRISVEEVELVLVLGEAYHRYQARTCRLVPGIW